MTSTIKSSTFSIVRIILAILLATTTFIATNACPFLERERETSPARNLQGVGKSSSPPQRSGKTSIHPHNANPQSFRYVSWATIFKNPSCFYSFYFYKKTTCAASAIQVAAEQIRQLIVKTDGMAAKFVRLTFHDCVGGCDGCVDVSNPSNFGLQIPIDELAPVVEAHKKFLTTADVWVLAGLVAARTSQQSTSAPFFMQHVQRPQCEGKATTAGPDRDLPSVHFTTRQVLDFFDKTFNFSPQEAVAILGAHTLGKATSVNSGFGGEGGWDPNPNVLDNEYYNELLDFGQFELDFEENKEFPPFPDQFYWEEEVPEGAPAGTFMLHADMALAFDMEGYLDPTMGAVNCTLVPHENQTLCPTSILLAQTQEYASNNEQWVIAFRAAYLKMVSTGCGLGVCKPI